MGKSKLVHLITGSEEGFRWDLLVQITFNQQRWGGYFYLTEERRQRKSRTIQLIGTTEEAWGWQLRCEVTASEKISEALFSIDTETRHYRNWRRKKDRGWSAKTFPRHWLQQFEIHHDWDRGETCYFLTPEEHHDLHHVTKR